MKLFDYDGPLMTLLRKLLSILGAGILFILCCLPVVTAGASFTALYDVTERNLKNNRGYVAIGFLDSLKENWRQTLPAGAVIAAILFVFEMDVWLLKELLNNGHAIGNMFVLIRIFQILLLIYSVWVFALISRFRNSLRMILKNASLLAVHHIRTSLGILLLVIGGALVIYLMPVSVFFVPVLVAWFLTALLAPVFDLYSGTGDSKETANAAGISDEPDHSEITDEQNSDETP